MDVQIDLRVAELLASRLCHDLVGPVGAVNNGLELLEDGLDDMGDEALKLAMDSAGRAAKALQYYRFAYGMAGSRVGGRLDELRDLAANFLDTSKLKVTWTLPEQMDEAPDGLGKLLLNMVLLGHEALPMGGALDVAVTPGSGGGLEARVAAAGERVGLRDETKAALAEGAAVDDLTPRNVQAYFTCLMARRMGADLVCDDATPGRLVLTVNLSA